MKDLFFLGTSLDDLRGFSAEVRQDIGTELRLVQQGVEPSDWKPMSTVGTGVREIRIRTRSGVYRVFYIVESAKAIYVLHAFRKTTQRTSQQDITLGKARYRLIP